MKYEITVENAVTRSVWTVNADNADEARDALERGEGMTDGDEQKVRDPRIVKVRRKQ